MARRENQGIQIAMIVFILTTLLFMVTTYFGYSSSTRLEGEKVSLESKLSDANTNMRDAETLATNLKSKIGFDSGMDGGEVLQRVDDAVTKTYGQGLAEENKNFLGIIQELNDRVTKLNADLGRANADNQKLRQEKQQSDADWEKKLAVARENESKAQAGYQAAVEENTAYFKKNEAINSKYVDDAKKAKTERDQATKDRDSQVAAAAAKEKQARDLVDIRTRELNKMRVDTPDQYDGVVLGVVAATKTVLLNRGRADGVRPKMGFGIYDAEDTNVRTAKRKASVEVTRVLGPHTSEARITETDHIHPIFRNDNIFSPTWSPGETLGIALVGKMDYDKDGLDDRDEIRMLITRSGGRIDAEEVDGNKTGAISVNTRYVVVGDGQLSADGLLQEADALAVERMSVSELLDLMGFTGRSRAITYDGVLRPGDHAPKPEGTVRSVPTSANFRPRTPLPRRNQPRY